MELKTYTQPFKAVKRHLTMPKTKYLKIYLLKVMDEKYQVKKSFVENPCNLDSALALAAK